MPDYKVPILETTYLSVPTVAIYRTIMRKMFIANEQMRTRLYKEEIYQLVKEDEAFSNYTMDELKQDLEQLVDWKNLIAIQDPGVVHTIAEYKNKQYRYSMSEAAIEIERLTIRLENLEIETSNLSTGYFQRIEEALINAKSINNQSLQDINEWWHLLQDDFQNLNNNYKDYLRDFYVTDTKNLVKSVDFVMHKERFIQYLQNFIKQMQLKSRKIRNRIETIRELFDEELLDKIVKSEMDIPHVGKSSQNENVLRESIQNKWLSFEKWFLPIDGQKPECERILDITNDIIRSIIENANMIVQMSNYGVSRKDDYKHFIQMFMNCDSLEDCHCLSAHVFGVQNIEHYKLEHAYDTDDIKTSVYQQNIYEVELESHSRTYRERRKKEGVVDRSFDKMMAAQEYEKSVTKKKELAHKYIKDHKLSISEIDDVIPAELRVSILQWITIANMNVSKSGSTEFGEKYHLIQEEGNCVLHCEDGDITMPRFVLEFDI